MKRQWVGLMIVAFILTACAREAEGPFEEERAAAETSKLEDARESARAELSALVENYFEETLELSPVFATFIGDSRYNDRLANSIGPEHRAKTLEVYRRYLAAAESIDPALLDGQDLLTLEIFKRDLALSIEGAKYPTHLVPLSQFFSLPNLMARLGSGQSAQPYLTVTDYENWLSRIADFEVYVEQAIVNMREGMELGIVRPRVIMEKVLPQLQAHIVDEPAQSLFYGPIENMPEEFSAEDRARLQEAYVDAISDTVVPSFRRLYDFVVEEYMPRTREEVGLASMPGGEDWYAYLVRTNTTTDLSPEEIHEIGLAEVMRIRSEMERVKEQVGFEGNLKEFFEYLQTNEEFYYENEEQLLDAYRELQTKIDALLPQLFDVFPEANYEVRPVEAFRAASAAGASYQRAAPDGSRPGIFYVNTYNLKAQPIFGTETLSLHEASPGHHFQGSIQQELTDLPRIRRFGGYTAYSEGWALYAESLGPELGLFTDPYQYYGRLSDEMLRAMRLVVDTGLHAKGWTRQQVIDYMLENSSMAESDVIAEAERYIAIPGQALAYKIGQLQITELRQKAERELGDNFDIKAFHAEVLKDGALPMNVLAAKIDRWIETQKSEA